MYSTNRVTPFTTQFFSRWLFSVFLLTPRLCVVCWCKSTTPSYPHRALGQIKSLYSLLIIIIIIIITMKSTTTLQRTTTPAPAHVTSRHNIYLAKLPCVCMRVYIIEKLSLVHNGICLAIRGPWSFSLSPYSETIGRVLLYSSVLTLLRVVQIFVWI